MRVVVVGALGGVGRGIVAAILERYEHAIDALIATARDEARLADFHAGLGTSRRLVVPVAGSVATATEAERLRDAILDRGAIDVVIASLGGWWSGSALTSVDDATWHATLDALLTTHFICARTFVPILTSDRAKYLLLGGGAALRPVDGSSLVSIAGAAQTMLTQALVTERSGVPRPLIRELLIDGPIRTSAPHHGPATQDEITAREVGCAVAAWCFDDEVGRLPRFDWPDDLIRTEGSISTMLPRTRRT